MPDTPRTRIVAPAWPRKSGRSGTPARKARSGTRSPRQAHTGQSGSTSADQNAWSEKAVAAGHMRAVDRTDWALSLEFGGGAQQNGAVACWHGRSVETAASKPATSAVFLPSWTRSPSGWTRGECGSGRAASNPRGLHRRLRRGIPRGTENSSAVPPTHPQLTQRESDALGRLAPAIGDLLVKRLGWICDHRRLNARLQILFQS